MTPDTYVSSRQAMDAIPPLGQPEPAIPIDRLAMLADGAAVGAGYRFELLRHDEVGSLVSSIAAWFPDIVVGGASRYLREDFYSRYVRFDDSTDADHVVLLLKRCHKLAGMFACELDRETQSVYAALGVAAPEHRGANLAQAGISLTEELGRMLGMGYAFGVATLKSRFAQLAFERAGWHLVGITPGYDREMVEPGIVKRVYEAMYAKVLVSDAGMLQPARQNLTPRTQAFFDLVFASSAA
jgi:hypothetical protein